jgi:hypothetical protein
MGAKGFIYRNKESGFLMVESGTPVEVLPYLVTSEDADWKPVVVENRHVQGSTREDGRSVYWVPRHNIS